MPAAAGRCRLIAQRSSAASSMKRDISIGDYILGRGSPVSLDKGLWFVDHGFYTLRVINPAGRGPASQIRLGARNVHPEIAPRHPTYSFAVGSNKDLRKAEYMLTVIIEEEYILREINR